MERDRIEGDLEQKFLNRIVRYRAITDVLFVGKVDSIAYWDDEVIFKINNDRFTCDLEWISENMIVL